MTKTQLEKWAIEEFWPLYRSLCSTPYVTKWTGGARGDAVKAIQQLDPSEQLRKEILAAIRAQIAHRKRLYSVKGSKAKYEDYTRGKNGYGNRNGGTWIRAKGWLDEIPSITEPTREEAKEVALCIWDGCELEAKTQSGHCAEHWTRVHKPEVFEQGKQRLRDMGMWKRQDETVAEWRDRCREYCKAHWHVLGKQPEYEPGADA